MIVSHGSRVPEPYVDRVRFAGDRDGWADEEAPPVMHVVLGGCTTEDEVGSTHALVFVWAFGYVQGKTLTSNRESFEVVQSCSSTTQLNASQRCRVSMTTCAQPTPHVSRFFSCSWP